MHPQTSATKPVKARKKARAQKTRVGSAVALTVGAGRCAHRFPCGMGTRPAVAGMAAVWRRPGLYGSSASPLLPPPLCLRQPAAVGAATVPACTTAASSRVRLVHACALRLQTPFRPWSAPPSPTYIQTLITTCGAVYRCMCTQHTHTASRTCTYV
jgi:hypothetical protein